MSAPAEPALPPDEAPVPPPPPRPSARSLVAGFLLSLLLCGVNSYLTLSFGVIEEGPTIAALFFFAFFFLSKTKIVPAEMAMVATMGSAGGSLGFISNFFAARAMTGEPYTFLQMAGFSIVTSLVGMAFSIPLRDLLVLRESLPWPGSKATTSVIKALVSTGDAGGSGATAADRARAAETRRQPLILLVTCIALIAVVVLNDDGGFGLIPSETTFLVIGATGLAIAWSPFAIGGAYLMGMRTCVGFAIGAVALVLMAPHVPQPEAPHRYVWPGIGFLLASGLMQMALNWKVIAESMRSLVGAGATTTVDDDPIMSRRAFYAFTAASLIVTVLFSSLAMGLSLLVTLLLIVVGGLLQNIIATRAAAQTAFNPARVMGVLLQGVTALAGGSSAGANLAGAGFVAGSGAQAGALTGDFVYGRWLRTPARWQFWGQLSTIVPCSLVSAAVFSQLQATSPMTLEGEGLPAPVAKMWAATALVFEGRSEMPPFAWQALAIGGAVGALYVLLESRKELEAFLPGSIGIGIGLVLPISYDLAFFFGGVLLYAIGRRALKLSDVSLTTVAVGCIVAEGLGGVLKPLLALAGVM